MPSNGVLNKAKRRLLERYPSAECVRRFDGTFVVTVGRHKHEGSTARHAWLYAGDIHLGAEDDEGLAPN